jgi:hypothetical protein
LLRLETASEASTILNVSSKTPSQVFLGSIHVFFNILLKLVLINALGFLKLQSEDKQNSLFLSPCQQDRDGVLYSSLQYNGPTQMGLG